MKKIAEAVLPTWSFRANVAQIFDDNIHPDVDVLRYSATAATAATAAAPRARAPISTVDLVLSPSDAMLNEILPDVKKRKTCGTAMRHGDGPTEGVRSNGAQHSIYT
jgi:hypothetical protein